MKTEIKNGEDNKIFKKKLTSVIFTRTGLYAKKRLRGDILLEVMWNKK